MGNLLKITRAVAGDSVSAAVPFIAPQGTGVQFDPATPSQYALANGTRGFMLERDVIASATYDATILKDDVFMDNLVPPIRQGLECAARKVEEAELEGDMGLVQTSGTHAITSGTAGGTALTYLNGLLAQQSGTQEVAGWIRAQLTPLDTANTVRIRVEFAG